MVIRFSVTFHQHRTNPDFEMRCISKFTYISLDLSWITVWKTLESWMKLISLFSHRDLISYSNHRLSTKHVFPNWSVASHNNLYLDINCSHTTMANSEFMVELCPLSYKIGKRLPKWLENHWAIPFEDCKENLNIII